MAKLARATLLDTIEKDLRLTLEPHQFAVRTPGGAEQLARTLRAWTAAAGSRVLVQLDLKNARPHVSKHHIARRRTALPRLGATNGPTVAARSDLGVD